MRRVELDKTIYFGDPIRGGFERRVKFVCERREHWQVTLVDGAEVVELWRVQRSLTGGSLDVEREIDGALLHHLPPPEANYEFKEAQEGLLYPRWQVGEILKNPNPDKFYVVGWGIGGYRMTWNEWDIPADRRYLAESPGDQLGCFFDEHTIGPFTRIDGTIINVPFPTGRKVAY